MMLHLVPKIDFKDQPTPLWYILATWFYSGRIKPASGTWGTLAGLPLLYLLAWFPLTSSAVSFLVLTAIIFIVGLWVSHHYVTRTGETDPSAIVIDEVAGMALVFAFLPDPMQWSWCLLGFVLFRLFDALKPWPISVIDKKIHGPLGIMLDDVLAAIISGVIIIIAQPFLESHFSYVF